MRGVRVALLTLRNLDESFGVKHALKQFGKKFQGTSLPIGETEKTLVHPGLENKHQPG
jgi:hypothetical protein